MFHIQTKTYFLKTNTESTCINLMNLKRDYWKYSFLQLCTPFFINIDRKRIISPVFVSKKDHLLEIENAQIFMYLLC